MAEQHETNTQAEGGEELARILVDHWHVGAGATVFLEELIEAHKRTGITFDDFAAVTRIINESRHYDFESDRLGTAFVPQANIGAVCDLLDQITELCEHI